MKNDPRFKETTTPTGRYKILVRCPVKDCTDYISCKGYCLKHYRRMKKHGSPLKTLIKPVGQAKPKIKYKMQSKGHYKNMAVHRWQAQKALGRELPKKVVIHHHYGDPDTLVVCPNTVYHGLLHTRGRKLGYYA